MSDCIDFFEIHNCNPIYYIADGVEVDLFFIRDKRIKSVEIHDYIFSSEDEECD